jgi:hypothetical protein
MFRRVVLSGNAGLRTAQLTVSASRGLLGTKSNQRASAKPTPAKNAPDTTVSPPGVLDIGTALKKFLEQPNDGAASLPAVGAIRFPAAVVEAFGGEKLFKAKPAASAALAEFVSACEADTQDHDNLVNLAIKVCFAIGKDDDVMGVAERAIKAASVGIVRGSLFDGDSVTFPLESNGAVVGRTVQVLVSESAKDSSKGNQDSPFFRHTQVKRFYDASTRQVVARVAMKNNSLPLLFGEAGTGKTMCGISVAAYFNPAGACLRLRCTADIFVIDPAQLLGLDPTRMPLLARWSSQFPKKPFSIDDFEATYGQPATSSCQKERDLVAQRFVLRAMDEVIKGKNRHPPTVARTLVVFLDDAGQRPTFVRAMCACFPVLQQAISERFSGDMCPVRIIMAGTNMKGEDHRAGSEAQTCWLYHVRSDAWSVR